MSAIAPTALFDLALEAAAAGEGDGGVVLRYRDGRTAPVPSTTWCAPHRPGDDELLARCSGPTIDVGCGPGRLAAELGRRGVPALGVDISPAAVRIATARGAIALRRSVFDRVPGEGRWRHALLADGNVGIGGNPVTLLTRCRELLHPAGRLLVETEPPLSRSESTVVRLESGVLRSAWFRWAHVAADDLAAIAARSGLNVLDTSTAHERWFACLRPA